MRVEWNWKINFLETDVVDKHSIKLCAIKWKSFPEIYFTFWVFSVVAKARNTRFLESFIRISLRSTVIGMSHHRFTISCHEEDTKRRSEGRYVMEDTKKKLILDARNVYLHIHSLINKIKLSQRRGSKLCIRLWKLDFLYFSLHTFLMMFFTNAESSSEIPNTEILIKKHQQSADPTHTPSFNVKCKISISFRLRFDQFYLDSLARNEM